MITPKRWRIAVGGIHIESSTVGTTLWADHGKAAPGGSWESSKIESSTFSPHRAGHPDFTVTRGDELLGRYSALAEHVEWVPLVHARALPGGAVTADFYRETGTELIDRLTAAHAEAPLDGVYLDIHGAMSVEDVPDAEGDLAQRVRAVVGPDVLVSASMDPHGNVSRRLVDNIDLLTSHRMSPHEDSPLTIQRAQDKLVACLDDGVRPHRAWITVPVLLPGEKACTRDEPAKGLYGRLPAIEALDGVIDAAIWIGYAWADEPRCRAAVVVSGTDTELIAAKAEELAAAWWAARGDFAFSTTSADADSAISAALAADERPFFISDSGDNPTAGGSGDVPYTLTRLLANPALAAGEATAIWASCVAPDAVATAVEAGLGAQVTVPVGGGLGYDGGASVELSGEVTAILRDDPTGGDIAVVTSGGVHAILTARRKPYHYISDFTALGLDPSGVDATVVKIGYLVPDLFDAAKGWILGLTPGGVDQDIVRLGHVGVERPIFPLDETMADPDFTPVVLSS